MSFHSCRRIALACVHCFGFRTLPVHRWAGWLEPPAWLEGRRTERLCTNCSYIYIHSNINRKTGKFTPDDVFGARLVLYAISREVSLAQSQPEKWSHISEKMPENVPIIGLIDVYFVCLPYNRLKGNGAGINPVCLNERVLSARGSDLELLNTFFSIWCTVFLFYFIFSIQSVWISKWFPQFHNDARSALPVKGARKIGEVE